MIVVVSGAAEADLESIGDWIARDNPARALTFVQELRRRCESLIDGPYRFTRVPRYEHLGIRRRVYRDYLIFYRIVDDRIEILRVIHGAREYKSILVREQ
jgi:toxin ParE1/3/4